MDNQKDQFGTTPDQTNASRTTTNPPASASTASGASAASRKSAPTPGATDTNQNPTAQSTASTPNAQAQTTANAGTDRQSEGEQTNTAASALLDTALNSGKKWIEDSGVLDGVNQLPQSLKDLGNRALDRVNSLSTTQKVVGGAILAAGIGWLATRKGKPSSSDSESSDSSSYNYGRQRDAGSYGRKSYGYQAPDASTSRRPAVGTSGRSDSNSAYGSGGSRYGSSGSYGSDNSHSSSPTNTGIHSGSGRNDSGAAYGHASARTDHGSQSSSSSNSNALNSDYRSIE